MLKFLRRLCCCALLIPLGSEAMPFVYNALSAGNCITVLDLAIPDDNPSCNLDTGAQPLALELLPNGTALYVAVDGQNTLQRYIPSFAGGAAMTADTTTAAITLASQPLLLAASTDSKYLWVARTGSTELTRVTLADNSVTVLDIGFTPAILQMNKESTRLYVAEKDGTRIAHIDVTATTLTAGDHWTVQGPANALALNDAGTRLYVSIPGSSVISIRGTSSGAQVATVAVTGAESVFVDGTRLLAGTPDAIQAWDASSLTAGTPISTPGRTISQFARSNDGTMLYVIDTQRTFSTFGVTANDAAIYPLAGRFVGPYISTLQFSSDTFTEKENVGTTTTIKVVRMGDITSPTSINIGFETYNLGLSNDYAQAGADYVATSTTLTFGPGESEKTIPVTLLNDNFFGNSEAFGLRLLLAEADSGNARLGTPKEALFKIENDDSDPRDRGGCSMGNGRHDPLLPLLLGGSIAVLLWRRSRRTQN